MHGKVNFMSRFKMTSRCARATCTWYKGYNQWLRNSSDGNKIKYLEEILFNSQFWWGSLLSHLSWPLKTGLGLWYVCQLGEKIWIWALSNCYSALYKLHIIYVNVLVSERWHQRKYYSMNKSPIGTNDKPSSNDSLHQSAPICLSKYTKFSSSSWSNPESQTRHGSCCYVSAMLLPAAAILAVAQDYD